MLDLSPDYEGNKLQELGRAIADDAWKKARLRPDVQLNGMSHAIYVQRSLRVLLESEGEKGGILH